MENLRELNDKLDFIKQQSANGYASVNDVCDVIEKLKLKVWYLVTAMSVPSVVIVIKLLVS